ncbi:MAG: DUF6259 domain-containing protein, partial [Gemmatimonadaceae bacterium]
ASRLDVLASRPPRASLAMLRMGRVFVLVGAGTFAAACEKAPSGSTLSNGALTLEFSPTDGHLLSLQNGAGKKLAGADADSAGLWSLDLSPTDTAHTANKSTDYMAGSSTAGTGTPSVNASQAKRFAFKRVDPKTIEMVWDDFAGTAAPALMVTATVQLRTDSSASWNIKVDGMKGASVDNVHFPRITGIDVSKPGLELAVPLWMGQRARDVNAVLKRADSAHKQLEYVYPGALSMQALALSSANDGGLYFSADDTLAFRKSFSFWREPSGTAGYNMVHVLSNPGEATNYQPSYAAIVGVIPGDWQTAVERYRDWGTKQYWARESRLATKTTPEWMRETGIWVWNRGESPNVLEPAESLMRDAKLPVSVFWHWWHHGPYDTSFPDYLPPREGVAPFVAAVKKAHAEGLHAIVYMNQRLWCTNTPSWTKEGAERWAVHERDGSLRLETYNVFNPLPCATMNPANEFWRNKYAGMADTIIKQYGIDGLYMDQAVLSLVDWTKDRGHPVGGGTYWMDGFRKLAKELRTRNAAHPAGFAGEGGGESWMPDLDAFLTLQVSQERYADPASGWEVIPMFQAAYHPYALTYGTYGSLTLPPYDELWPKEKRPPTAMQLLDIKFVQQFHLEQARMFVWGMQPTIANFRPNQLTERRREIDYLERLAKLRYGMREYFQEGTFVRAPKVDVPTTDILLSRISIYAARLGGPTEAHITSPEVLSAAWQAKSGSVAIALASITTDDREITISLPASAYGMSANTNIIRHDANGITPLGQLGVSAQSLKVKVGGLQPVVIELVPSR